MCLYKKYKENYKMTKAKIMVLLFKKIHCGCLF